jgi:hypothetical protein
MYRVSCLLWVRVYDQWNGREDKMNTLLNDWYYDDWHRDVEDMQYVNFRYNDHRDREPLMSFWTHQIYKPEADRAKEAYRFYRYGNNSYVDNFLMLWKKPKLY